VDFSKRLQMEKQNIMPKFFHAESIKRRRHATVSNAGNTELTGHISFSILDTL
jgi:hypothetical protein